MLPRGGRFDPDKARALRIPVRFWSLLQKGETVTVDGKAIRPETVVGPPRKGIHVVYSTDTRPVPEISEAGKNSDLMVLEGIYPGREKLNKAREWGHMTFEEAAHLAFNAHTKELWLTHFSQSVEHPEEYLENAAAIFRNTKTGKDGMKKSFVFED
jgi:ribonuclease Z